MRHIEELFIQKFRGISGLNLLDCGEINLLVGGNNSGKTSVLEVIEFLKDPFTPSNLVRVSRSRESFPSFRQRLSLFDSIEWLFPQRIHPKDSNKHEWDDIRISALIDKKKFNLRISCEERTIIESSKDTVEQIDLFDEDSQEVTRSLEIKVELNIDEKLKTKKYRLNEKNILITEARQNNLFETQLITPSDNRTYRFSSKGLHEIIMAGDRHKVIAALKLFDSNVQGIELLSPDGRFSVPYIKHKMLGLVPLSMFGDGLRKAMALASAVVRAQKGILLIDEIETAVHTKALGNFFGWLINACKSYKVQLFATTHSLEAIDAIAEANREHLDSLVAYRLDQKEGTTFSKRFNGSTLYNLRHELGQDVR